METVNDFKDLINAELDKQALTTPELTGLSTSNAAEWVGIRAIVASAMFTLVAFWSVFKTEVLGIVANQRYGTIDWWKQTLLNYQDGDALPEGKVQYATVDLSKRIITRAAITKNIQGLLIFKVAKAAGKLTTDEYNRLNAYLFELKPFGRDHVLISRDADEMRCDISLRYDGKLVKTTVEAAVIAAINNFLAKSIDFNGNFNINLFRDAIEAVPGVLKGGVTLSLVQIRPFGGVFSVVLDEYSPYSGYYNWLPLTGDNASTLNMVAA